jgi:hypothetical protein
MIIEDKGFRDGIKSSYTLIWRNWVDVLLSFMGLGTTYTLFMVAMLALYGTAGAVVGWFLVSPALVTLTPQFLTSILSVLAFILFGFIPAYFLFRPLKVAYNTILYGCRRQGIRVTAFIKGCLLRSAATGSHNH